MGVLARQGDYCQAVSVWVSYTSSSWGSSPRRETFFFLIKGRQGKKNQESKQGLNTKRPKKFNWANIWQNIFKLSLVTLGLQVWVEVECKPWRNPFPASYLQGNVSVQSFLLCSGQQGTSSPGQGQEGLCKRLPDCSCCPSQHSSGGPVPQICGIRSMQKVSF